MAWHLAVPSPPFPPAPSPSSRQPPFRGGLVSQPTRRCRPRRAGRSRGPALSKLPIGRRGRCALVAAALPEEVADDATTGGSAVTGSSARTQLDLLEQLASGSEYESDEDSYRLTIREQLSVLVDGRVGDFSIPLGNRLQVSMNSLTISQRRNIKRQAYLNEVSQRNDSPFFAIIGAFVIVPPVIILTVAILTGYVQLFP